MRHGAIAADASGQASALWKLHAFETLFDALVRVAETLFQAQDLLAHDLETEMPGLDDAGMHWTDSGPHHAPLRPRRARRDSRPVRWERLRWRKNPSATGTAPRARPRG